MKYFLLIFFIAIYSFGQTTLTIPELTGPSPEVASLGRYGDVPLNLHSGMATINVPLYTLDFDGFVIPINISYNTGGIRVSQEAGWVGLGWSLSSEPVITRQIKGLCDITVDHGPNVPIVGFAYTDVKLPDYVDGYNQALEERLILHEDVRNRTQGWDTQPDIFTVNLFGETAKFILKQKSLNGGIIGVSYMNSDTRFKVEFVENDKSFIVTNDRGFKFYFKQKEYSLTASGDAQGIYNVNPLFTKKLITGWKLDKIVSPRNKILTFTYSDKILLQDQPSYFDSKINFPCGNVSGASAITNRAIEGKSLTGHEVMYLTGISMDDVLVEFKTSDRLDIPILGDPDSEVSTLGSHMSGNFDPPQKLDNIIVKDGGNEVINYNFRYTYFNQSFQNNAKPKRYIRLKLDAIYFNGEFYRGFEYIKSEELPSKISKSIDYWGFYNGKGNSYNYPTYREEHRCGTRTEILRISGADRRPDFNFGENGLLNKVIYPTKGYTKIDYEPHKILLTSENTITKYPFEDMEEIDIMSNSEFYPVSKTFSVTKEGVNLSGRLTIACGNQFNEGPAESHQKCDIEWVDINSGKKFFELINADTGEIIDSRTLLDLCDSNCTVDLSETGVRDAGGIQISEPGNYMFKVTGIKSISNMYDEDDGAYPQDPDYGKQYSFAVRFKMTIPKTATVDVYDKEIGGMRIKAMENYSADNILLTKKDYDYALGDESQPKFRGYSSGLLVNDLIFSNTEIRYFNNEGTSADCGYVPPFATTADPEAHRYQVTEVYSQNMHAFNTSAISHIGYSRVTETITGNTGEDNSGKKTIFFANKANQFLRTQDSNIIYPSENGNTRVLMDQIALYPANSYEESNGDILKEEFYNSNGDKIKEVEYKYDFHDYYPPKSIATGLYPRISTQHKFHCSDYIGIWGTLRELQVYKIKEETTPLIKKTETDFLGGQAVSKVTNYTYNNQILTSKVVEISSDNHVLTTKFFYPEDIINTSFLGGGSLTSQEYNTINRLKKGDLHRIANPIQVETYQDGIRLSTRRTTYKDWGDNLVLPDKIMTSKGTASLKARVQYHRYDSYGNPEELSLAHGPHIVYLWGYEGQHPIARIEDVVSYSSIPSALITAAKNASNSGTEADVIAALDNIRDALPDAVQMTTYTYNPLIGVSTITDPRGEKTTYIYDTFNRLEFIKDETDKLLEEYKYHYKN